MLNTVLSRADDADESAQLNPVEFMDVSHLLLDMCRPVECSPDELIESDQAVGSLNQGDELCAWWTHLLTCAVHWAAGEKAKAKQRYTFVRTCPKALLADNLALALGNAFCCRKLCTDDQNNKKYQSFVWVHCTKAQRALRQLDSKSSGPRAALTESVKLLAYDWMLGSLSDVWQDQIVASRPYWTQPAAAPLAELYYQTLEDYRLMAQDRESTFCKLALFEAAGRMLTGANPIPTWQSLLRCSRMCRDGSGRVVVTSDRRRIDALLQLHDSIARP
uniref:Uncharacterized protein n=1 Tax=Plectus sambesii TaxID=2011161 RepID=A0A914UIQ2_9BILA